MSARATRYLASNLPELRAVLLPDGKQALTGDGIALLLYLCDVANDRQGLTLWYSADRLADDTGLDVRVVRRYLARFEQVGWLTRTGQVARRDGQRGPGTPVYALTLVPGVSVEQEHDRNPADTVPVTLTSESQLFRGKPLREKGNPENEKTGTTTPNHKHNPNPNPLTGSAPARATGKGGQGKDERHDQVAALVLDLAAQDYARTSSKPIGDGLLFTWRKEQASDVAAALDADPGDDLPAIARVAFDGWQRRMGRGGFTPTAPRKVVPVPPPACPDCDGLKRNADGLSTVDDLTSDDPNARTVCPTCAGSGVERSRGVA